MMLTVVLIPPLMKSASRFKFIDYPNERKVHTGMIPRVGGVAMIIGAVLPFILLMSNLHEFIYVYVSLFTLLIFGLVDDRYVLNYKFKFLGQILAVLSVVFLGGVVIEKLPLFNDMLIPKYIAIPFTIFALLGVTNAINLSDGLDGLAGGQTILSLGAIALISYKAENIIVLMLALSVMGSILGFLRFNTYPATVFMGDTGSQFLGFTLGVAVILLTQQGTVDISPAIVLLLLGLPIIDTIAVMILRMREGRSPFSPDKKHVHHRLLGLGFKHHEAVLIIYIIQTVMVISAYLFRNETDWFILSLYAAYCALVLSSIYFAEFIGWRTHIKLKENQLTLLEKKIHWLRDKNRLLNALLLFAAIILISETILAVSFLSELPIDGYYLVIMMIALLSLMYILKRKNSIHLVERIVIYTFGALINFIVHSHSNIPVQFQEYYGVVYVILAVVVFFGIWYSPIKNFEPTPLDFLVIFIAIVSAVLPEFQNASKELGISIAHMILLFYAIEFIVENVGNKLNYVRYFALTMLSMVMLKGVIG